MTTTREFSLGMKWLRQHARHIICPACAGKRRPDRIPHTAKCPCFCPTCKKYWSYRCNLQPAIEKQVPRWNYMKEIYNEQNI